MVGVVRTEELNINSLEAGVVAVLENKDTLQVVTIQHINPAGDWVVMGTGFEDYAIPIEAMLCKLVVLADTGVYPLKYNQWANALRNKEVNTDTQVEFDLVSPKFKAGKYVCTCSTCTSQFLGGRSQPDCMMCSTKNVTAKILIKKVSKPKRPRMLSPQKNKEIALNAFKHGRDGMRTEEFVEWLENQF